RALGEVSKAALLTPYVGATAAATVGASGQVIALFVNGAIGIAGGALALDYGASLGMAAAFVGSGCALCAVGYVIVFGMRSRALQRLLARLLGSSRDEAGVTARLPGPYPFAAQAATRACQALQLGVLSHALGQADGLRTAPLLEV